MHIHISLAEQTLTLTDNGQQLMRCLVSAAARGGGEQNGSLQTPRGKHIIRAKIGTGQPVNSVFRGRRPTGEIYRPALDTPLPDGKKRDWILTRILWLSGCEVGKNRLGSVDTMRRYIYLHGTPDSTVLGRPGSIGCIRLANADIIALFEQVAVYTPVFISEE